MDQEADAHSHCAADQEAPLPTRAFAPGQLSCERTIARLVSSKHNSSRTPWVGQPVGGSQGRRENRPPRLAETDRRAIRSKRLC